MKINLLDLPQNKIYFKLENNFIKTVIARMKEKYESCRKFYTVKLQCIEGEFKVR